MHCSLFRKVFQQLLFVFLGMRGGDAGEEGVLVGVSIKLSGKKIKKTPLKILKNSKMV